MKKDRCTTNVFIKECIAQALSKLIESKPLSDIKITELARIAGVSRMSYSQPFGIYHDMEHMIHYFRFVLENKEFLYAVVNNGYGNIFLAAMTNYIVKKWLKDKRNKTEYYTLCAFSGSLYNLYVSWAKNDFEESPEEMAKILSHIHGAGNL